MLLLLLACADYSLNGGRDAADSGYEGEFDDNDGGAGGDGEPSETEDDFLKLEPAATDAYVFVVNSARNTVSRISVPQMDVITAKVGINPLVVRVTSDYLKAVTFNEGSDDVSIIDSETLDVDTVEVRDNFNAMEMSPDGRWVVCFHDGDNTSTSGSEGGLQSFNEVSIVDTETLEHHGMAVGFNPRQVAFTPDSTTALVVSDDYLARIDLTEANLSPVMIPLSEDLLDPPVAEELEVDPLGQYAFVRQFGENDLLIIDLLTDEITRVPVGNTPTDLDLSPNGEHAVVVSRGSNQLFVFHLDDPFGEPEVLDMPADELLGSLQFSPDSSRGVLYTTAARIRHFTSWDIDTNEFTVRRLEKPVRSVALSPTGGTMTVFHTLEDAPDVDPNSVFKGEHALTLVDMDDYRANALLLPDEPSAFANSHDGQFGFFIMEDAPFLEVLLYDALLYDEVRLRSAPVHVGTMPETTYAYVNQEHELGRLSFYEPQAGTLETITGFELNSEIEH